MIVCKVCGAQVDSTKVAFCPKCNSDLQYQDVTAGGANGASVPNYAPPMKWFKFIIWFSLFAGALLNLVSGIRYINGSIHGEYAEMLYEIYGSMRTIDLVYGCFMVFIALYAIFTRIMLAGYRKIGPSLLYGLYIMIMVSGIIYAVAFQDATAANELSEYYGNFGRGISFDYVKLWLQVAGNVIENVVVLCINVVYFGNRKRLFNK